MPYKDPAVRKAKHKEYSKKHYEKNKAEGKNKVKKSNQDKKKLWREFKESVSCSKCGFKHPAAMDFHHVDPATKIKGVHEWARKGSYRKAFEEAKKCIVLCSNCHRILHYDLHKAKKKKEAEASLDHSSSPYSSSSDSSSSSSYSTHSSFSSSNQNHTSDSSSKVQA